MESLQLEVEDFIASRISENPAEQVWLMERILTGSEDGCAVIWKHWKNRCTRVRELLKGVYTKTRL